QRSLVEQVAGVVEGWLANLKLADEVALHVVMGGEGTTQRRWRMDMHRPAVVVGTVDSLVSKAPNRGYGIARAAYPIDFALVTNGALRRLSKRTSLDALCAKMVVAPCDLLGLPALTDLVARYGSTQ